MRKTDLGYELDHEEIDVSRGYQEPKKTFFQDWEAKHIIGALFMLFFLIIAYGLKYSNLL